MSRSTHIQGRPTGAKAIQSLKAELAARIVASLDRLGLTVREAQARTGQAAGDFSRLRGGQLDRFTIERLLGIAEALGERLSLSLVAEGGEVIPAVPAPLAGQLRGLRILCRRYAVRRLGAFGSVLTEAFDSRRSDIDLAVEFGRTRTFGLADQYFRFKAALERLLGREVDLVELRAMPVSRLKQSIERSQIPLFESAAGR
jgi:predicted nucleotidyltransferase